jgi:hypothetical protein
VCSICCCMALSLRCTWTSRMQSMQYIRHLLVKDTIERADMSTCEHTCGQQLQHAHNLNSRSTKSTRATNDREKCKRTRGGRYMIKLQMSISMPIMRLKTQLTTVRLMLLVLIMQLLHSRTIVTERNGII